MKNYIGIQDDRHRLIDHDHRLNEKIADLQYIIQPQFIAHRRHHRRRGPHAHAQAVRPEAHHHGQQPGRFRRVCCAIIGLDPRTVDHIRLADERGFGTTDLSKIKITGDVTLDEAKKRAKGFEVGLHPRREVLRGHEHHGLRRPAAREREAPTTAGEAARAPSRRRSRSSGSSTRSSTRSRRGIHVVFGAYDGPIDAKPGEKVVFIGDCAKWKGQLGDELVQIDEQIQEPRHAATRTTRSTTTSTRSS